MRTPGNITNNSETRIPLFRKEGFWKRQINNNPTDMQKGFDVLFGIVLMFAYYLHNSRHSLEERITIYMFILLESLVLVLWLLWPKSMLRFGEFIAGTLFAVFLMCIFQIGSYFFTTWRYVLIPVLLNGFVPLLVSLVFLRNVIRAWIQSGDPKKRPDERFCLFLFGIFAVPAFTALVNAMVIAPLLEHYNRYGHW